MTDKFVKVQTLFEQKFPKEFNRGNFNEFYYYDKESLRRRGKEIPDATFNFVREKGNPNSSLYGTKVYSLH